MISEFREEDKIILKYLPDSATWSGHHMKLIPTDPKYIPTQTQQIEVLRALIKKYPRYEINSVVTNEINFIDNAGDTGLPYHATSAMRKSRLISGRQQ